MQQTLYGYPRFRKTFFMFSNLVYFRDLKYHLGNKSFFDMNMNMFFWSYQFLSKHFHVQQTCFAQKHDNFLALKLSYYCFYPCMFKFCCAFENVKCVLVKCLISIYKSDYLVSENKLLHYKKYPETLPKIIGIKRNIIFIKFFFNSRK